ncbi:hypothetical protein L0Z72_10210, partial [candidate division KSB1 bacterium]|nr:hypothetical protein [candidate division KSB1 bacterium]
MGKNFINKNLLGFPPERNNLTDENPKIKSVGLFQSVGENIFKIKLNSIISKKHLFFKRHLNLRQ